MIFLRFSDTTDNMRNDYVIDLETKYSFDEVGGRNNLTALGVSFIGLYSYRDDKFFGFRENELEKLNDVFESADRVIGFNIRQFDLPVLQPHVTVNLSKIPTLDIFEDVTARLGHRIGLDSLSKATLGAAKFGHGLDSLKWYRAGDWEQLERYCLQDVRLTRDLYEFGKANGHLLFDSIIDGKRVAVPVKWGFSSEDEIRKRAEEAVLKNMALEIEYVSREDAGDGYHKKRKIEVRKIFDDTIEAYCHLRKDVRNFRIGRILEARLLDEPAGSVQTLF